MTFAEIPKAIIIYIQLSRCCTARRASTRFSLVGPTKVQACKSFLFSEKFSSIENKEHPLDFVDFLSHSFFTHFVAMLQAVAQCHNQLLHKQILVFKLIGLPTINLGSLMLVILLILHHNDQSLLLHRNGHFSRNSLL